MDKIQQNMHKIEVFDGNAKKISCRCEKNCKERCENQLTMLKAVAEIPGQSAKGKEQRRRYALALWH